MVDAAPSTASAAATLRPALPSHGVVRRSPASSSMTAMGTLTLHTVCRASTNSVHGTPIPSADT
ncbi:hypothetical protein ABT120_56805 [Nonomuraea angiospora]|uniref:hypothetical protein n=1 Tax=Nonomuraea angiospora TaxID=46172 RepID=UPI00331F82A9